ncbi:hypothetical protein GCM10027404_08880 [Arthrobacter tumbae]
MQRPRLEQASVKLLEIAYRGRNQALRMVRIPGSLARLLNIQQRPRELGPNPFQIPNPASRFPQFPGNSRPAIVG